MPVMEFAELDAAQLAGVEVNIVGGVLKLKASTEPLDTPL